MLVALQAPVRQLVLLLLLAPLALIALAAVAPQQAVAFGYPVCAPLTLDVPFEGRAPVTFTVSCSDPEGRPLTYTVASGEGATASNVGPEITYTPARRPQNDINYGSVGHGNRQEPTRQTSVYVAAMANPPFEFGSVSVKINLVSHSPVCIRQSVRLVVFGPGGVTGRMPCADPTGLPLTYSVDPRSVPGSEGSVSVTAGGTFTYHAPKRYTQHPMSGGTFFIVVDNGVYVPSRGLLVVKHYDYVGPPATAVTAKSWKLPRASAVTYGVPGTVPIPEPSPASFAATSALSVDGATAKRLGLSTSASRRVVVSEPCADVPYEDGAIAGAMQGVLALQCTFKPAAAAKIRAAKGPVVLAQDTLIGSSHKPIRRKVTLTA